MGYIGAATHGGSVGFVVSERGRIGGRFHLHGLFICSSAAIVRCQKRWKRDRGFERVEQYDEARGAVNYCGKYVLKDAYDSGTYYLFDPDSTVDDGINDYATRQKGSAKAAWKEAQERQEIEKEKEALNQPSATVGILADFERLARRNNWVDEPKRCGYDLYRAEVRCPQSD